MDFKTPARYRYSEERPPARHQHHEPPAAGAPPPARPRHEPKKNGFIARWWKRVLVILLILALAGLVYGYMNTKNQLDEAKNKPQAAAQSQSSQLQDQIAKLVMLPTDETPTIATVTDASKLKGQAFFADAQNGDKVLIYTKANKAVLYRPSTGKVIEYTSVNLSSSQSGGTGTSSTTTNSTSKTTATTPASNSTANKQP